MTFCRKNYAAISKTRDVVNDIAFVLSLITVVFINKIVANHKTMIAVETIFVIFIALSRAVLLVTDILLIKGDKENSNSSRRNNLLISRKVTKASFEIFTTMSFLFYDCGNDVIYISVVVIVFLSVIASFVSWYMYRADLSKDNIDENSIDYRLIDFDSDESDNDVNNSGDGS